MPRVTAGCIRFYQKHISPHFPAVCRFRPSCSHYMLTAIERYGTVRGTWLGMLRILRCNPFSDGGWDPVPLQYDFLGRHKTPQPDPLRSPAARRILRHGVSLSRRDKYRSR